MKVIIYYTQTYRIWRLPGTIGGKKYDKILIREFDENISKVFDDVTTLESLFWKFCGYNEIPKYLKWDCGKTKEIKIVEKKLLWYYTEDGKPLK